MKKFRRLLRKRGDDTCMHLFQVVQVNAMRSTSEVETKEELLSTPHPELNKNLAKYDKMFQEELPPGLPPKRSADHKIEVEKDLTPLHHRLYQLSPAELEAAKNFVQDFASQRENSSEHTSVRRFTLLCQGKGYAARRCCGLSCFEPHYEKKQCTSTAVG